MGGLGKHIISARQKFDKEGSVSQHVAFNNMPSKNEAFL